MGGDGTLTGTLNVSLFNRQACDAFISALHLIQLQKVEPHSFAKKVLQTLQTCDHKAGGLANLVSRGHYVLVKYCNQIYTQVCTSSQCVSIEIDCVR